MRNIEIKARVNDINEIEKKAKQISDSPLVVIDQNDIFYKLPSDKAARGGRLKTRQFKVHFVWFYLLLNLFKFSYKSMVFNIYVNRMEQEY